MPEGTLTPEQHQQIQDWLKERWKGDPHCPICRSNNWQIALDLVTPPIFMSGGISIGGPSYPQVMNVCSNCGHTVYFNAKVMGIVGAPSGDAGQQEKAKASGGDNG